jgi:DNA-binding MarR family transcriptional regulator
MREKRGLRVDENFEQTFPEAQTSATECHLNLLRAGALAEARVAEVLRPFDLSGPSFSALATVGRASEPLSPCKISERMVVPRNTLTHILDVLEGKELVRRARHPHHRGMVLVELTAAGRAVLDAIFPRLHALEAEWWAGFSEEERQTLIALLGRAQEALADPEQRDGHHRSEHHHHHGRGM